MFLTLNFTVVFTIIACIVCLFGLRYLARFLKVGRAQAGKLVRKAETADPLAMYRHDIETAKVNLAQAEDTLASIKGTMLNVERHLEQTTSEKNRLEARIKIALDANDELGAGKRVQELQVVEVNIKNLEEQRKAHDNSYAVFSAKVKKGREQIRQALEEVSRLESQLEVSKAEVQLGDMSKSFTMAFDAFSDVATHRDEVLKQIDQNKAKTSIQAEAGESDAEQDREEAKIKEAEAKELLEKYKQRFKPDV